MTSKTRDFILVEFDWLKTPCLLFVAGVMELETISDCSFWILDSQKLANDNISKELPIVSTNPQSAF
jgi:hypothetical protein